MLCLRSSWKKVGWVKEHSQVEKISSTFYDFVQNSFAPSAYNIFWIKEICEKVTLLQHVGEIDSCSQFQQ